MAAFWDHRCGGCGLEFTTSSMWEFYRDAEGELREYGHPFPASKEAARAGVHGTACTAWCPTCRESVTIVESELDQPVGRSPFMWFALAEAERPGRACPQCGNDRPVIGGDPEGPGEPCPVCGGTIRVVERYMS